MISERLRNAAADFFAPDVVLILKGLSFVSGFCFVGSQRVATWASRHLAKWQERL